MLFLFLDGNFKKTCNYFYLFTLSYSHNGTTFVLGKKRIGDFDEVIDADLVGCSAV